jgi:flagellar biosynthesis GTPase FlhF
MGTTILVAQPFYTASSIAAVSVGKVAEDVTVFIQGVNNPDNFGSGVIIGRSGKTYTVLTAGHVVEASDQYTIKTSDGIGYTLKNSRKISGVDLAVVEFESTSTYALATLGNSDQVSQTDTVFVAGFPKPGQNITVPIFTITTGAISSIIRKQNQTRDGYALSYNNETRAGMSGGPVFNSSGQVIAIHGRKEGELGGGATAGAWLNLGVPINFYKTGGGGGTSQIAKASVDAEKQRAAQEAQQRAQQEAQQRAAQEAQQRAQQEAQQRAAQEAQQRAQQEAQQRAAQEAQLRAQQEAQQRAAQEAQLKAQQEAQQREQPQTQPVAATAVLASVRPIDAIVPRVSAPAASTKQVCEDIRINMIVTKRCRTEKVDAPMKPGDESASANSPEAYVNNGNLRAASGSYQSAIEDYNGAIQRNAGLAIAYFNRGFAYYKMGDSNRAAADFAKAGDLFRTQGDAQRYQQTQEIVKALTQAQS